MVAGAAGCGWVPIPFGSGLAIALAGRVNLPAGRPRTSCRTCHLACGQHTECRASAAPDVTSLPLFFLEKIDGSGCRAHSRAVIRRAELPCTEQSSHIQSSQCRTEQSYAEQSYAQQSYAEQSFAEQSSHMQSSHMHSSQCRAVICRAV
eukprot:gene18722-biopygen11483